MPVMCKCVFVGKERKRERENEREREKERQADRETERQREAERDREIQRATESDREERGVQRRGLLFDHGLFTLWLFYLVFFRGSVERRPPAARSLPPAAPIATAFYPRSRLAAALAPLASPRSLTSAL